jgi:hypothetical protein
MKKFTFPFIGLLLSVLFLATSCSSDDDETKSPEKSILEFSVNSSKGTINENEKTISITLPFGTDQTKLKPTVKVSLKATVSPASEAEVNLTNPVKYTVTAEDGSTQQYTVSAIVEKNNESKIVSFTVNNVEATINEEQKTITATLPKGTSVNALKPVIVTSTNATVDPASESAVDFTNPVKYTVTSENGNKSEYTVTINVTKSTEAKITSFVFNSLSPAVTAQIDENQKTITASVPYGTNITALTPTVVISTDATVSPSTAQNFQNQVIYTVTAEDGITKADYAVTVTVKPFDAAISNVNNLNLLEGDEFTLTGKFAASGNTVSLKNENNDVINATIVSENATSIIAKIPASIQTEGKYTLSVVANGTTVSHNKTISVYKAGKPIIFYTDKTTYVRDIDSKIIVTGRNLKPQTTGAASAYLLFSTTANVTTNNLKLAVSVNEEGTIATRTAISILDPVDYTMSIFIDGVESNKVNVKITN